MESQIYTNIINLVAGGYLRDSIDELLKYIKKTPLENDVILQAARYSSINKDLSRGLVTDGQSRLTQNQINYAIIELVNKAKDLGLFNESFRETNSQQPEQQIIFNEIKTKILFLSANPQNTNPLRLDKEIREIENELFRSRNRDKFEIIKKSAVRVGDLEDGLLEHSPDFVHFSGHGTNDGIILMDSYDLNKVVNNEPLSRLFGLFTNEVSCVFLNSCYSESQASMIKRYIPNVIGMKRAVPDDTAIGFATVFYKAIGAGKPIEFAFEFAKLSIDLNQLSGGDIPVLL